VTRFAIDPMTLVRLAEDEEGVAFGHQLVAPSSIRSRALDLLLRRVSAGELGERDALQLHERMTELKLRSLGDRVSRRTAWQLARAHGWDTIADAEYLAVATLQADALVALDPALAAKASGVVPLASLEDLRAP
jgi:predicted nucleic acid-binding protein